MFVALRTTDRSRVTSIAAQWDQRLDALRELAASGQLACPGCEQRLWLRTGVSRRRHFAHRQLADCPLAHQSPELLEVKAQLYQWLESKYPGKVHLDMAIGAPGCDKLLDLLVEAEAGRKLAYWIFDRQQRARDEILAYQALPGVRVHFIHTESTLVQHSETEIVLTASQRAFIGSSDFDAGVGFGGHLHFLNGADSKLRIYRGLRCVHAPNLYAWEALREDLLSAAWISPKTGEIVVPEDVAARETSRLKRQQEKSARAAALARPPPDREQVDILDAMGSVASEPAKSATTFEELAVPSLSLKGPFRCEDCGMETMDWSSATPSAGTCVCRNCTTRRYRQKRDDLAAGR
jgi:hypothetical protein